MGQRRYVCRYQKGGNVLKTILKFLLGFGLLIAPQACAPGQPTPDLNTINTAIAQTLVVTRTFEPGLPVTGDESPTPTPSPELPTATQIASPTMTAIPLFTLTPALTFTPATARIHVSVPTNCRIGPGRVYGRVGGLLVGEVADVVGRHATRDYWIIRNPDRPGETCWLWGEYATVTGNTDVLPIYTPPPTPTPLPTSTPSPDFTAGYSRLESCAGTGWWVDIELENNGGIPFQSLSMTVRDTVTNIALSLYEENFTNRDGCNESSSRDHLSAGDEWIVSSPIFPSDPSGHEFRVTMTLCSNPGQNGLCVTETISFTP